MDERSLQLTSSDLQESFAYPWLLNPLKINKLTCGSVLTLADSSTSDLTVSADLCLLLLLLSKLVLLWPSIQDHLPTNNLLEVMNPLTNMIDQLKEELAREDKTEKKTNDFTKTHNIEKFVSPLLNQFQQTKLSQPFTSQYQHQNLDAHILNLNQYPLYNQIVSQYPQHIQNPQTIAQYPHLPLKPQILRQYQQQNLQQQLLHQYQQQQQFLQPQMQQYPSLPILNPLRENQNIYEEIELSDSYQSPNDEVYEFLL